MYFYGSLVAGDIGFWSDGFPGALRSINPSGPAALNFTTQSDLQPDPAEPGGLRQVRTLMVRRHREQASGLRAILRFAGGRPYREVLSAIGMANSSPFASLNQRASPRLSRDHRPLILRQMIAPARVNQRTSNVSTGDWRKKQHRWRNQFFGQRDPLD